MNPIYQLELVKHFVIAQIGNMEIAFTNSAVYIFVAVGNASLALLVFQTTLDIERRKKSVYSRQIRETNS